MTDRDEGGWTVPTTGHLYDVTHKPRGWTVGYTKEEYDNAMAVATVQVIRKAFEEPHEDCRIKSFQDWITSRAKQLNHKAEREEKGLHSELCDHCAYIEHLLTALVE